VPLTQVLELNASDTRNKKAITEELSDVVLSKALSAEDSNLKRRLVIMDEVGRTKKEELTILSNLYPLTG
jgi:hypothetical protein